MIDPSINGMDLGEVRFPLERSKLHELSRAYGDNDPVWRDEQAAHAAGFDSVPVPPTATIVGDHWSAGGIIGLAERIGAEPARLLHGEASWELLAPIEPGEQLVARRRVVDVAKLEGRRGGAMTFVTMETEFTNAAGEVVVRRRDILIETGATP